jgi:undecaprenyl-diphosphatase
MEQYIINADIWLFQFLNGKAIFSFLDIIMPFITEVRTMIPLYIGLFIWLLWKGGLRGRLAALALALCILCADTLNTQFIKPMVGRQRPCQTHLQVRSLIPCGPGQSFPSTHAVNNACAAILLGLLYRRMRLPAGIIAIMIGYSRIYVGVHYPLDIAAGFAEGAAIGALGYWAVSRAENKIMESKKIK